MPSVSTPIDMSLALQACQALAAVSTHWITVPLLPTPKWADALAAGLWNHESVPARVPCMTWTMNSLLFLVLLSDQLQARGR